MEIPEQSIQLHRAVQMIICVLNVTLLAPSPSHLIKLSLSLFFFTMLLFNYTNKINYKQKQKQEHKLKCLNKHTKINPNMESKVYTPILHYSSALAQTSH